MKALFIGNSYTFCNNLPGTVKYFASTAGMELEVEMVARGGETLEGHWYSPDSRDLMTRAEWDFVILQEQSTRPVEDPERMLRAAERIHQIVSAQNTILYLTWARKHIPEMQEQLTSSYERVANKIQGRVAPVGPAWQSLRADHGEVPLYVADNSHPSPLGTYLAGAVIYSTMFGKSPLDLPSGMPLPSEACIENEAIIKLDDTVAGMLRTAAAKSCEEYLEECLA
jgi:hypothetical protein